MLLVALFGLAGLAAAPARAQDDNASGQTDQYRCDPTGSRCATYRCDPAGEGCQRIGDWETRDYSRGVDGDVSSSYDRRYEAPPAPAQSYDRRYDQRSDAGGYDPRYDDQGGAYQPDQGATTGYGSNGYDRNGYASNWRDQAAPPPPQPDERQDQQPDADDQDYASNQAPSTAPSYHYTGRGAAEYRCTDDGYRCAYFRCDPDGEDCHRVSAWSSRADMDRRPDDNGW
jgi:hypothetical protein